MTVQLISLKNYPSELQMRIKTQPGMIYSTRRWVFLMGMAATLTILHIKMAYRYYEDKKPKGTFTKIYSVVGRDKKLASKYSSVHSDKWIVVTTISYPTPDVRFLAAIPGWQLLVVGDTKTPEDWSLPGCIYLSVEDQERLGLHTTSNIPLTSYARKNVGYLFAISHGAKVIYETDDDNRPLDRLKNFVLKPSLWTLGFDGKELFNPYRYFGQPTLWPRGYPLSAVGRNYSSDYIFDHYKTPLIQQGVVNGDPDMDAIFRLTWKQTTSILNVTFDQRAPPVIVPNGVFSPFNSQNTLFLYDALWALLLPVTTTQCVCDIWRGYWSQRLMWEIGGHLAFFPPNAFQKRNAHSYLQDAMEEKDLHFETERLVTFLQNWKCGVLLSFFQCVIQLTSDMSSQGFLKYQDVRLVNTWVGDLKSIGYREPIRKLLQRFHSIPEVILPNKSVTSQRSKVIFNAVSQFAPSLDFTEIQNPLSKTLTRISELCHLSNKSLHINILANEVRQYTNKLLIIVFNFPHYKNIPFLETLYRMHFPNILYCGSNRQEFDKQIGDNMRVSFIEVDIFKGYFGYRCLIQAMKMNYKVDGYLYIGDDVLLNVWNLHEHPLDKLWIMGSHGKPLSVYSDWLWFSHPRYGNRSFTDGINELRNRDPSKVDRFLQALTHVTGYKDGICVHWSDITYVPASYKDEVLFFMESFSKYNLFLEMAIPSVLNGIEKPENLYVMPGIYLEFKESREKYHKYYNSSKLFLHPIKISKWFSNKSGQNLFCGTIFPLILSR